MTTPLGRELVARALAAHRPREIPALPGRTNHLPAGVLVPLRFVGDDVEAVLTLRSPRLGRHAGEVAWPGGRPEPGDADLLATAVREAGEEVGARVRRVFGPLSSVPLYTSDFRLAPFVAEVEPELAVDGSEVVALLPVRLGALLSADAVDAIAWSWDGREHRSPVWALPAGPVVFGGTAHVLWELLEVLAAAAGRAVPPLVPGRFTWSDAAGGVVPR